MSACKDASTKIVSSCMMLTLEDDVRETDSCRQVNDHVYRREYFQLQVIIIRQAITYQFVCYPISTLFHKTPS
jgi:hypothetical protein